MPRLISIPWLLCLPVIGAVAVAVWQMRYDWTYDETYHYGWTVLPLALYLFSLRWRDRPEAVPPRTGGWMRAGWIALALAYPLAWLVREANPEWRLMGVVFAGLAVLTALLTLAGAGGIKWARHFAGPVLFFLTAVPWPSAVEKQVTSVMMPANAAISLEVLHWLQVPAVRTGHLITLPGGGTLGVEEACSGVRSLQSTLMMAIFLGELNSLRLGPRLLLLVSGMVFALLTNVLRTVWLSTAAARAGLGAAEEWHDAAGLTALAVNTVFLFLLTRRFVQQAQIQDRKIPDRKMAKLPHMVPQPADAHSLPLAGVETASHSLRGVFGGPGLMLLGLAAMFPLTEGYYRRHEAPALPPWNLPRPVTSPGFREAKIDPKTKVMLQYSDGWSARWQSPAGQPLHGFYFFWDTGKVSLGNIAMHQPGVCLQALGMEQEAELAPLPFLAGTRTTTARLMRFDDRGRPLFLLHALVDDLGQSDTTHGTRRFDTISRLQDVLAGRRNRSQRLIEIGLWDATSEEAARAVFGEVLGKIGK